MMRYTNTSPPAVNTARNTMVPTTIPTTINISITSSLIGSIYSKSQVKQSEFIYYTLANALDVIFVIGDYDQFFLEQVTHEQLYNFAIIIFTPYTIEPFLIKMKIQPVTQLLLDVSISAQVYRWCFG